MATDRKARVFDVESNFHRKAKQPGGMTRAKAIAHAQAKIDQSQPEFTKWLGGELKVLNEAIQRAEENSADTSTIDQALYHCRQLRDVGSTMGFELVTFVADNLCDILEAIRAGAHYDKEMVGCHLAALTLATQAVSASAPRPTPRTEQRSARRVQEAAIRDDSGLQLVEWI